MRASSARHDLILESDSGPALRLPVIVISLYSLIALAVIPFASRPGPEIPGITALFVAVVFVTELSTSFLLFAWFARTAAWPLLILGGAYSYSALMLVAHLAVFPGAVVAGGPLLPVSLQSTGWIFVLWVLGFSFLALIAVVTEARGAPRVIHQSPTRAIVLTCGAVMLGVLACVLMATVMVDSLPPVLSGTKWTTTNQILIFLTLTMIVSSIAIILASIRSELFLWLSLVLTVVAFANILSETGGARYSVGWTFGRVSWILSSCVLFLYFLRRAAWQQTQITLRDELLDQRTLERDRFRLLAQGVKDCAIYMLDPHGRVTSWNSGAQHIKGYSAEQIVGRDFSILYTPEDRVAGLPARVLQQAEHKGRCELEGWRVRKDGSRFWASSLIDPIRDETGKLVGFAEVTRDITEQRNASNVLDRT